MKDRIYADNGLISLECGIETAEVGGWFKKRYTRVADLKGIRMRTFGLGGDVLKKFGVTTTLLDPFDIVPAVKKEYLCGRVWFTILGSFSWFP